MKSKILIFFIASVYLLFLVFTVNALLINSSYTTSPPTIDGVLSAGEWNNGMNITLNGFFTTGQTKNGELYVLNDAFNLYIAMVIPDATLDTTQDYGMCDFDKEHDHNATTGGEDALDYNALAIGYSDAYWNGTSWWLRDIDGGGTSHGSGNRTYSSGNYTYEFSKPLNSGESKDMALNFNDIAGFRIETWDQSGSEYYRYPQNTVDSNTSRWGEWDDLRIASSTTTSTTTTSTSSTTSTTSTTTSSTTTTAASSTSTSTSSTTSISVTTTITSNNVVINEFMPNPVGTEPDNEWVELYNNDSSTVNITGWKLGDMQSNYTLSGVIASGGFGLYNGTTTGLQLSNTADAVYLYNSSGALVDGKSYNSTTENVSYMRSTNGGGLWVLSNSTNPPTPGTSNAMLTNNILLKLGWNLISLPLLMII